MKWKLFQLSAILNLAGIAGFFVILAYALTSPATRTDINILFLFILGAGISAARDLIGLSYVNLFHSDRSSTPKYRVAYVIFGIIQTLASCGIIYSLVRMMDRYDNLYWSTLLLLWQVTLVIYALTSLCMTILDFFILPALHRKQDPSAGILEDNDEQL